MSSDVYTPSEWGSRFHNLPHDEALGAGSAGVGKSFVLLAEPFQQIATEHARCQLPRSHPDWIEWGKSKGWALHLRRTHKMLLQTLDRAKAMYPTVDPGVRWSEENRMFTFSSGYKIQFGHCHEPGDWEQYFSQEYTIILFDELIQFLKNQYEKIKSRCRTSDHVLARMLKVRAMSNPTFTRDESDSFVVDDPFWVRERFVDPAPTGHVTLEKKLKLADGTKVSKTRIYFPGTLYDNPDKEFARQYEATLLDMEREADRQSLLHGNWYYQAGQYFTEVWNPQLHTCDAYRIPPDWPVFRSMDWGYKSSGCIHWWAMTPDGELLCIREWMFRMMHPKEVATEIKRVEKQWNLATDKRSSLIGPCDTQLWEKKGEDAKSKYEEFLEAGVNWVQADKRSRAVNAMKMFRRLKSTGTASSEPSMRIFATCKELIRTIPMLPPCADTGGVITDEPGEIRDDHALDSAWYACAYASRPRAAATPRDEDDDGEKKKHRRRKGAGRYGYGQRVC
jgi:hypothetical protein